MAEKKPEGYKYVLPQGSILYTEVLSPYVYNNLVKLYPLWLHPNVITLLGFISATLTPVIVGIQSPDLKGECTQNAYFTIAALYLAYIIFDNTDGKQARRTKTSSNAGEVFDHGVDMSVTTISMIIFADAIMLGSIPMLPVLIASHSATFMNNWYHKVTGVMSWGGRYLSVDEATLTTFLGVLFAGIYGPSFYNTQLLQVDALGEYSNITITIAIAVSGVITTSLDGIGKLFSTFYVASGTGKVSEAFFSLMPLFVYLFLFWANMSSCSGTTDTFTFILASGLVYSIMGTRLIFSMKFGGIQLMEQNVVNVIAFLIFTTFGPYSPLGNAAETCGPEQITNARYMTAALGVMHFCQFVRGLTIVSAGQPLFRMEKKSD